MIVNVRKEYISFKDKPKPATDDLVSTVMDSFKEV
jgi:hypothetical protein